MRRSRSAVGTRVGITLPIHTLHHKKQDDAPVGTNGRYVKHQLPMPHKLPAYILYTHWLYHEHILVDNTDRNRQAGSQYI